MGGHKRPQGAHHKRIGGRPAYIDPNCEVCGTPLVYRDRLETDLGREVFWYDEFVCPSCHDGTSMDLPPSEMGRWKEAIAEARLDDVRGTPLRTLLHQFRMERVHRGGKLPKARRR